MSRHADPVVRIHAMVDAFADALKDRLALSADKPGRGDAWADPGWEADCQRELLRHVAKGDPLDVAAYAAFCWHHGWRTAVPVADPLRSLVVAWHTARKAACAAPMGNVQVWKDLGDAETALAAHVRTLET